MRIRRWFVALLLAHLGSLPGVPVRATTAPCSPDGVGTGSLADRLVPGGEGRWVGVNLTHRFEAEFSALGARLSPPPSSLPAWEWRFALARLGGPEALHRAGEALTTVTADRADLQRGRTLEWYINSAKGLEHGLEIAAGAAAGPLWLDFTVDGSLTPKVGEGGAEIAFVDGGGRPVLRYRDLHAVDARGRDLDARWERHEAGDVGPAALRLVLEAGDRPGPVRVMGRIVEATAAKPAGDAAARSAAAGPGAGATTSPAPLAAPANDLCGAAETIPAAGPFPYLSATHDITGATGAGDPPAPSCQANIGRSIWFRFTPVAAGWYTFSLCQDTAAGTTLPDTVLAVYTAAGDCAGFTEITGGCDDDACSIDDLQSVLADLSLSAGTSYYVVAWQYGGAVPDPGAASIQLRVTQGNPPGPAPANDQCAGAEVIPGAGPFPYLTAITTDIGGAGTAGDPPAPSCQANVSRSIWYAFTPALSGRYTFSTCADAPTASTVDDTVMALYAAAGNCSGLVPVGGACDDDSCAAEAAQSVISGVTLAAGTTYDLVVWQYGTSPPVPSNTAVQVRVSQIHGPVNDTCEAATPVALDTPLTGTTALAANDYQLASGSACFSGLGQTASTAAGGDVVYQFTAPAAGTYSFRAGGIASTRNAVLYVTSDCPAGPYPAAPAACLGAANRNATFPAEEVRCLPLAAGHSVHLFVDDNAVTTGGAFTVEVNACIAEAEPNNVPAPAEVICGIEGAVGAAGDVDHYSLGVPETGARVFALADGAAANSTDFDLRLTTATDTLEYDDQNNDTSFGTAAPNLSGAPANGATSFLRVSHYSPAGVAEPYRLYAAVQGTAATASAEVEPNDTPATATAATNQFYAGALGLAADSDHFAFTAQAGDLVAIGLDLDPFRNGTPFNGTLALLDPGGVTLVAVNDGGATSSVASGAGSLAATTPFSPGEAITHRIRASGTHYARVASAGTAVGDYLLSIARNCRVLPGTDLALAQSDGPDPAPPGGLVTYTLAVHNQGGQRATGVTVRDDPPAGTVVGTVTPSQGSCTGAAPVVCHLGTLPAGATATITLEVTAPAVPGTLVNSARVTTYVVDTGAANDASTATTVVGQPDSDGDGVVDGADCAPGDPTAWAVPGEARDLLFPSAADTATMQWSAPSAAGGTVVRYDLLRSSVPGDFSAATCVAAGITATGASDPALPAPRYDYLVRARNACGGNLGLRSDGTPRTGAVCP